MLRFDERLVQILLEARNQAIERRNVDGISSIDIFTELIEDSESLLYSYLAELNDSLEINSELFELNEEIKKREDISYSIPFEICPYENQEIQIVKTKITERLYEYILAAQKIADQYRDKDVKAEHLLYAIVKNPIKPITKCLRALRVDIPELRQEIEYYYSQPVREEREEKSNISIPEDMKNYLSVFSGDNTVLGRDREIESSWNILLKKTKRNIILVGDQGVGKTAIVKKMVSQIKNHTAPEEFKDFTIISLDVTSIISGTRYRGDAEERFTKLINYIKQQKNVILFIDEAHLILGAGSCEGSNTDLSNSLKPLLAGDGSRVIAATTTKEYEEYFSKDPAMRRRFEKVFVEEPNIYEVYPMIKARVDELSKYHGIKISHQMVNFIALYASCFSKENKNPDRTLDLIDRSMVTAKRKNKKVVDKASVLANFNTNLELFKSIPENDKRATAYHEAGHYIAFSFLPFLTKTKKPVVVSIYPAEEYVGVTIAEPKKNVIAVRDKKAYLEIIASCLAGGIAERIVNDKENDGVSSDSEYATQLAKTLVTKTGFYNDFYYSLENLETERSVEQEVRQIKAILSEAKKIAEDVINDHRKELDAVVEVLMQKHVASDEELKKAMENASKTQKELATV